MSAEAPLRTDRSGLISHYACKKCGSVFGVPLTDPQAHLLKRSMRCPNSAQCGGKIWLVMSSNITTNFAVTKMSALQLYQASLGIGLPKEKKCSPTELKKLMVGAKVTAIQTEKTSDPHRSIIHSLTLDNGKQIHFASSTLGATIYKVTEGARGR